MKLITLNAWGGRSLYPLMKFLSEKRDDTDIFCFQEVLNTTQKAVDERHPDEYVCGTLFTKMWKVLPGHRGYFAHFNDNPSRQSLALFVREGIPIVSGNDCEVYKASPLVVEKGSKIFSSRKIQWVKIKVGKGVCTIVNFHGLWNGGPKTDTPERLAQSYRVLDFLSKTCEGPRVFCGDFNLLPGTESLRILETGMRNLVTEYGITSTRTPLYRHYDNPAEPNFADYILVSRGIAVKSFEVLSDVVSDHSPLFLEFSLEDIASRPKIRPLANQRRPFLFRKDILYYFCQTSICLNKIEKNWR